MMGRSRSAFILLAVVICNFLLLHSSSSSSRGIEGIRKVHGALGTGVDFVPYDVEGTTATSGDHKRKMMSSSSGASKDAVEVMDYSDPGANINPKNGFLGSPPPPPTAA